MNPQILLVFGTGEQFANYPGPGIDRTLKAFEYDRGMSCYSITGTLGVYQCSYKIVCTNNGQYDSKTLRESWKGTRVEVYYNGVLHTVCFVKDPRASENLLEIVCTGLAEKLNQKVCSVYPDTVPHLATRGRVRRALWGTVFTFAYPWDSDGTNIELDFGDAPATPATGTATVFKNNVGYAPPYTSSAVCNGVSIPDALTVEEIERAKFGAICESVGIDTVNDMWVDICTRAGVSDYVTPISGHTSYGIDGDIFVGAIVTDLTTSYLDLAAQIGATMDCALVERGGQMMFVPLGAIVDAPNIKSIGREIKLPVSEGEITPRGLGITFELVRNFGFLEGLDISPSSDGPFQYPTTVLSFAPATPPNASYLDPDYYKRIVPNIWWEGLHQEFVDMQSLNRANAPRTIECEVLNAHDIAPGDGVRITYPRFDIGTNTPWLLIGQRGDLCKQSVRCIFYATIEGSSGS